MLVEICVSSFTALKLASKYEADRVEVCQELSCGGLTPSIALVQKSLSIGLNTQVLIRPRSGDFVYTEDEKTQIIDELLFFQELGVQGAVVGALNVKRALDLSFLRQLRLLTPRIELTFHKAFDDIYNWQKALEELIAMKYDRVLTAGSAVNVELGIPRLKQMIEFASDRIQILPGGGIIPENIGVIIDSLQHNAIHFSGTKNEDFARSDHFGAQGLIINEDKLRKLIELSRK
jgi:copper homeostasis protein